MWTDILESNGLSVVAVDSQHVMLKRGGRSEKYRVVLFDRQVHPRDVGDPPGRNALLVAPAMSAAAVETARLRGWSVALDGGPAWVRFGGAVLEIDTGESNQKAERPARRGRPGYGTFTVLRALLSLAGGASQEELAEFAKVSQPRVSQTLRHLGDLGLAKRAAEGWVVAEREQAIAWWVVHYPGPGGLRTHWFGLEPVVRQAYVAHELLASLRARPAVSGDAAADLVASWRVPQHALLYAERGADLSEAGLTPSSPGDATLTLILPADHAVWPIGRAPNTWEASGVGDMARASALQVLYDLKHSHGADADEAAQAWLDWMLAGEVRP